MKDVVGFIICIFFSIVFCFGMNSTFQPEIFLSIITLGVVSWSKLWLISEFEKIFKCFICILNIFIDTYLWSLIIYRQNQTKQLFNYVQLSKCIHQQKIHHWQFTVMHFKISVLVEIFPIRKQMICMIDEENVNCGYSMTKVSSNMYLYLYLFEYLVQLFVFHTFPNENCK